MNCIFLNNHEYDIKFIETLIQEFQLNLSLSVIETLDCSNKSLKKVSAFNDNAPLLFFDKQSFILAMVIDNELIKTNLNWQSLQKRIVSSGKNNELLLKACKLSQTMSVIDGTAGFGIDGLILASTGARVTLIEQNPIIFLMLYFEKLKMSQHKNWQKLMDRINIVFGNSNDIINNSIKHDLIYLDPMFPNGSYKGAVNKNMQVLHSMVSPPNSDDELKLFNTAIAKCDKLVIKRPIIAPNFADKSPNQSFNNEVIRFDVYMENNQ
ncbi:class I SAM-dependent methyltransferase [Moraxella oblonga]|uniref:class I SAM-dependent methyltransferase n=1 Tax=Moraxella oblonga TaxID=200413 RepID=UPI000A612F4A|nr:class I SAM-dependent methyltransferase [Moraxella oblonga]